MADVSLSIMERVSMAGGGGWCSGPVAAGFGDQERLTGRGEGERDQERQREEGKPSAARASQAGQVSENGEW